MITAIIIDDEQQARVSLRADLEEVCPQVAIVGEADSVKAAVAEIKAKQPDLVFLDIELGDGTGFNVLEQIKGIPTKIIFTTAYDHYAIKAFRFSAIDYLLKPVDPEELQQAVEKVEVQSGKDHLDSVKALLQNLQTGQQPRKVVFRTSEGLHVYEVDQITRCESDGNYCKIFFHNYHPLVIAKTMKEVEAMLADQGFERTHHSHIVNLAYVKKYISKDGGYIEMQDGTPVPVAQRKKSSVMEIIEKLGN